MRTPPVKRHPSFSADFVQTHGRTPGRTSRSPTAFREGESAVGANPAAVRALTVRSSHAEDIFRAEAKGRAMAVRMLCGALFVALMSFAALPGAAQTADEFGGVSREEVVTTVDRQIRRHFAHWQGVPGYDYAAAFATYRAAALAAPDRATFSTLTEAFVARLQNGHTYFYDQPMNVGDTSYSVGHYGGQWIVTGSLLSAVPAGSVITAVDEEPIDALYQRAAVQIAASSDRARRSRFGWPRDWPMQYTLHLADGRAVAIDRAARPDLRFGELPPQVFARWQEPGVGYLRVHSFNQHEYEAAAVAAMRGEYASARTVIVDARGNGGGNTPNALGRLLLGRDWRFWQTSQPRAPVTVAPRARPPSPKYIVLIDRHCASACEDFVMPFSISGQAVLVGETTMGTSGQPEIKRWPNGMELWVSRRRQWFPDGREFEGVGVAPDVAIELGAADFARGAEDRILRCALALAHDASAACS